MAPSLYERLGGIYGIAGAVDVLVDRLYDNAAANMNAGVAAFHALKGHAGFKFLVTAWSVEQTGGPKCYPGRDMKESHAELQVTEREFDIVATEISATLNYVGVPPAEHHEFMAIIERYRPQVVAQAGGSTAIRVTETVDATPGQLFAVLADPERHTDIDGAGMLRGAASPAGPITATGDEFVMNMHNKDLGDYQMRNVVTVYELDRAIGWAPSLHPLDGYTDKVGDMQATGHSYEWYLEPAGPGQTKVTQVYDWGAVGDETFLQMFPMLTAEQLTDTIKRAASAAS